MIALQRVFVRLAVLCIAVSCHPTQEIEDDLQPETLNAISNSNNVDRSTTPYYPDEYDELRNDNLQQQIIPAKKDISEIVSNQTAGFENKGNASTDSSAFQESDIRAPRQLEETPIENISMSPVAPLEHIRVVLIGRSGFGVSSTIRQLVGTLTKCEKAEGTETLQDIFEYTISDIPGTNISIKLLDVPGFVDGRILEKEAQILATLKSYVSKASNGSPPDFFLALSGFDDNRYVGVHSLFVQFLKRVELFENEFLKKISAKDMNIIFLFTKLMSETKVNQRRPGKKIDNFKDVIGEFSSLIPPYQIIVGDNHAKSEHGVEEVEGYYLLPNKELYPKNIWEAMINANTFHDKSTKLQINSVLTAIKDNRQVQMKCKKELIQGEWGEYKADADAFFYLLQQQNNLTIEQNEINEKIQTIFDDFPEFPDRMDGIIQKTALQLILQNENVTNIKTDIPKSYEERAAFFQKSSLISSTYPSLLLDAAFGLEMAEYIKPFTVGYGYDVLSDEVLQETPFKTVRNLPSSIGYKVPNFMKCKKFSIHDIQTYQSYFHNISDYFMERLEQLKFANKENITVENFIGKVKDGYNLPIEEGVDIATLMAAKEVRVLKCTLAEKGYWGKLNDEFEERVKALEKVDLHNRDSVNDWKNFFDKYGTHIVVQGYGGGRLVGSMVGANVKNVFENSDQAVITNTLNSIIKFSPFSVKDLEKPTYQIFSGEVQDPKNELRRLHNLQEARRDELLREWEESLNSNFEMLKNEFTLERMSKIVKEQVDEESGEMVDEAIVLLLQGELEYQRRTGNKTKGSGNGKKRTTTVRPQVSSSTQSTVHVGGSDNYAIDSGTTEPSAETYSQHYSNPSKQLSDENQYKAPESMSMNDLDLSILRIKEQIEREKKESQDRMEDFNRAQIRRNQRQESEYKQMKIRSCIEQELKNLREERCGGFKQANPFCWSDWAYNRLYNENGDRRYVRTLCY